MLQGRGTSMMKSDRTVKTLLKLSHHAVNRHVQNLAKESNVRQTRQSVQRSLLNQKLEETGECCLTKVMLKR